jgi:Spy/CpxP family protein refolding chaperone
MKINRFIVAAVAAAVLLAPAVLTAADHPRPERGFDMGPEAFGMGGMNVLRFTRKLGLSSDQIAQIKGILSTARTANQTTTGQIQANRQEFEASYNPAQYDATAVQNYINQQTPLVQQLVTSRFQTEANLLAVLTPDQLTQYNQLRTEMQRWRQSNPWRH